MALSSIPRTTKISKNIKINLKDKRRDGGKNEG
jgi:hypothetical protein